RIIVKMNALVEPSVIDALYRAAQAGVKIDLVIRGICCLRAGLPGVSDTVRVISLVDKFLEHSRVFFFENAGNTEVFLGSADWMPRNFFRRIEVMFPVEDKSLKARIVEEILPTVLADTVKARLQLPNGTCARAVTPVGQTGIRSQVALQGLARESARDIVDTARGPFVPILRRPGRNGKSEEQAPAAAAARARRAVKRGRSRAKTTEET